MHFDQVAVNAILPGIKQTVIHPASFQILFQIEKYRKDIRDIMKNTVKSNSKEAINNFYQ